MTSSKPQPAGPVRGRVATSRHHRRRHEHVALRVVPITQLSYSAGAARRLRLRERRSRNDVALRPSPTSSSLSEEHTSVGSIQPPGAEPLEEVGRRRPVREECWKAEARPSSSIQPSIHWSDALKVTL